MDSESMAQFGQLDSVQADQAGLVIYETQESEGYGTEPPERPNGHQLSQWADSCPALTSMDTCLCLCPDRDSKTGTTLFPTRRTWQM